MAMSRQLRPFLITILIVWVGLGIAATMYAPQHEPSTWIIAALLPAFLIEAVFYLFSCFPATRSWFAKVTGKWRQGSMLFLSALLPYLVFSIAAGVFDTRRFLLLAALCALLSWWQLLLPWRVPFDLGFLIVLAAPLISSVFKRIYVSPDPKVHVDILGHLMWIRVAILAWLSIRRWDPGKFSLWPAAREWRIGALGFILIVVPLFGIGIAMNYIHFEPARGGWLRIFVLAAGYFFGCLWVVALSEELFLRGVIQKGLLSWSGNPVVAIALASLISGSVHLWYRQFPNWRFALLATIAHAAYGVVYLRTNGVNASMVTHASVVATWRALFH